MEIKKTTYQTQLFGFESNEHRANRTSEASNASMRRINQRLNFKYSILDLMTNKTLIVFEGELADAITGSKDSVNITLEESL